MGGAELAMVLTSALLHALWSASIKGSGDPLAFNLAQGLVTLGLLVPLLPWAGLGSLPPGFWILLAATGLAHGAYWYGLSLTLAAGDLSLTYPIVRSTPALLPWVAVPLMGERLTTAGATGIAVVVAGIWLVSGTAAPGRMGRRALRSAGFTLATTVAYSLCDKQVMLSLGRGGWQSVLPTSLVAYLLIAAAGTLGFVPFALPRLAPAALGRQLRGRLRWVALAAAVGLLGYGLILEAYRSAPASYVVAARQLSVVFALGIAVLSLGERLSRRRVVGSVATVAGVALIALAG